MLPAAPSGAAAVFGERMPLAIRFAEILADTGVTHGLIGPREVPRLWDRHVLNCAVVQDAFPAGAKLVDVGSGAGLPGVALAIVRPDLEVHLVEPMLRRTQWLSGVVEQLGLENVTVHRGRAEDLAGSVARTVRDGASRGQARQAGPLVRPAPPARRHPGGHEGALGRGGAVGRPARPRPARSGRCGGFGARRGPARRAGAHRRPPLRAEAGAAIGSPRQGCEVRKVTYVRARAHVLRRARHLPLGERRRPARHALSARGPGGGSGTGHVTVRESPIERGVRDLGPARARLGTGPDGQRTPR